MTLMQTCSPRRGFTLLELLAAAVMIGAMLAMVLPLLGWVAAERRAVARRERAALEASNLMERIAARPWEAISNEELGRERLGEAAARVLPHASLGVEVAELDGPPAAKRVAITIRWDDRPGVASSSLRLSAFVHRRGPAS